jgi:hypothetical protein
MGYLEYPVKHPGSYDPLDFRNGSAGLHNLLGLYNPSAIIDISSIGSSTLSPYGLYYPLQQSVSITDVDDKTPASAVKKKP